ncbi:hypothetical protein ACQJBY_022351 [Aegilops geniculata]
MSGCPQHVHYLRWGRVAARLRVYSKSRSRKAAFGRLRQRRMMVRAMPEHSLRIVGRWRWPREGGGVAGGRRLPLRSRRAAVRRCFGLGKLKTPSTVEWQAQDVQVYSRSIPAGSYLLPRVCLTRLPYPSRPCFSVPA